MAHFSHLSLPAVYINAVKSGHVEETETMRENIAADVFT
jgi:hypothetical protein